MRGRFHPAPALYTRRRYLAALARVVGGLTPPVTLPVTTEHRAPGVAHPRRVERVGAKPSRVAAQLSHRPGNVPSDGENSSWGVGGPELAQLGYQREGQPGSPEGNPERSGGAAGQPERSGGRQALDLKGVRMDGRQYLQRMVAKHPGVCAHCGLVITYGEQIARSGVTRDSYPSWLHAACASVVHQTNLQGLAAARAALRGGRTDGA